MKHFSRLGPLQAVTYTIKVVVSKKWCKIDTLLLHTTDRKYRIAYRFWPFLVTLRSFAHCRTYQMQFGEHLCNISHDFYCHNVSHSPLAIAELLVAVPFVCWTRLLLDSELWVYFFVQKLCK